MPELRENGKKSPDPFHECPLCADDHLGGEVESFGNKNDALDEFSTELNRVVSLDELVEQIQKPGMNKDLNYKIIPGSTCTDFVAI